MVPGHAHAVLGEGARRRCGRAPRARPPRRPWRSIPSQPVRPAPPAPITSTSGVAVRGAKRRAERAEQRACTETLQEFSAIHQGIALRHTLSLRKITHPGMGRARRWQLPVLEPKRSRARSERHDDARRTRPSRPLEADPANSRMRGEEGGEVIDAHGVLAGSRNRGSRPDAALEHVPDCDAGFLQCGLATRVRRGRFESEKLRR